MSTERFVESLFARLGDWFAELPTAETQVPVAEAGIDEVTHG